MAEAIQDTHELKRHLETWFFPQNNFMGFPELGASWGVAALPCNGWQLSYEMGGSFAVKYAFQQNPMIFSVYMKAQDNEMLRLLTSGFQVVFVAAAIWASIPIITFAQTTEPVTGKVPAATKPMVTDAGSTDDGNSIHNGESAQAPLPVRPILPAEIEVEIQNRFNELRSESLDNRANAIDWWLAIIAIVLTAFGIVIPIAGIFGFRRFREIEAEAKTSVETVTKLSEIANRSVEEIERNRKKAEELIQNMNAETAIDDPEKASQAVESIQENPEASPISKTIALAVSLQQKGEIDEAIEKWRAVAHVAEESDKDQAAVAWFSVGYLLQDEKPEDGISAYTKATRLKPDYTNAYLNRGIANRNLGLKDKARKDFETVLNLARNVGNADLMAQAEELLRTLNGDEDK